MTRPDSLPIAPPVPSGLRWRLLGNCWELSATHGDSQALGWVYRGSSGRAQADDAAGRYSCQCGTLAEAARYLVREVRRR